MEGSVTLGRWTLRITGKVKDVTEAAKALKDSVGGRLPARRVLVEEGRIVDLSQPAAWDAKLALDGLGIECTIEEQPAQVVETLPPEVESGPDLDEKVEAVKALAARFVAIPEGEIDPETGLPNTDRLKGWLEIAEAETDVVLLVATATLLVAGGAPEHLVNVVIDRVRVLQRPQPGETRVLYEGTAELEVELNDHEQIEASRELAKLAREKARTDAEMKSVGKRFKARIELLDESIEEQLDIIEKGKATRNVRTRTELDYGTAMVRTIRLDTMAIISERKASENEVQVPLPFGGKEPEEAPEEADDDWSEEAPPFEE